MSRLWVFALVLSLGNTSIAFAGESLLASGTRRAREAAARTVTGRPQGAAAASVGQASPAVSEGGIRKRTKLMIFVAAAVGFAATAYAIDHKVQDVTPSTLGTRED